MIKKNYPRLVAEAYQRFSRKKRMDYDYYFYDSITKTNIYFNEQYSVTLEKEYVFIVFKNRKKIFSEEAIPESKVIRIRKLVEIFGK